MSDESTSVEIIQQNAPINVSDLSSPEEFDNGDDSWVEESAGADTSPSPVDSTADAGTDPDAGSTEEQERLSEGETVEEDASRGSAERRAAEKRASADDGKKEAKKAQKADRGDAVAQREARLKQLQDEINRSTWEKNEAIRQAEARLADIQRRAEALESRLGHQPSPDAAEDPTGGGGQRPGPGGAPVSASPNRQPVEDAGPPPTPPSYTDYDTEEEFQTATKKWQEDFSSWNDKVIAHRTQLLQQGLESRLTETEQRRLAQETRQRFSQRLAATQSAHEDFDEVVQNVGSLQSDWALSNPERFRDPSTGKVVQAPFLWDVILNTEEGPEFMYYLGANAEDAQVLAELQPNQAIRDAIISAPSPARLMSYFATPEGREHFDALKAMHPTMLNQQIGLLTAQTSAASSDPTGSVPQTITQAAPPVRSPRGTPRAQASARQSSNFDFEAWMAEEDAREQAAAKERLKLLVSR